MRVWDSQRDKERHWNGRNAWEISEGCFLIIFISITSDPPLATCLSLCFCPWIMQIWILPKILSKFCFLGNYRGMLMFCSSPPQHCLFRHRFRTFVCIFGSCKLFYHWENNHGTQNTMSYERNKTMPKGNRSKMDAGSVARNDLSAQ